jgi:hypothetical protein
MTTKTRRKKDGRAVAKAKGFRSVSGAGALLGAALSPREIMVAAAAVKIAEKAAFNPADQAALSRVFAKLTSGHSWQAKQIKAKKKT